MFIYSVMLVRRLWVDSNSGLLSYDKSGVGDYCESYLMRELSDPLQI